MSEIMSELGHLLEFKAGRFTRGPMFASPQVEAAYKTLLEGDAEGAEARFRRILQEEPKNHEAMAGLAVCVAESGGRFLSAERLAKQAVRMAKTSAAGYIALFIGLFLALAIALFHTREVGRQQAR